MRKFAFLMIMMGIFITVLSVPMVLAGNADSTAHVISIIDIAVGIVMILLGTVFLAGRKK